MRKLALALVAIAACDFDSAFERYCEGNPLCAASSAGSGGSIAPGGSGGGGGTGGSGGAGGDGGGGAGGNGGDGSGWQPPGYCDFIQRCPGGKECRGFQHVCIDSCSPEVDDCPAHEPHCGFLARFAGREYWGCGCNDARECQRTYPGLVCNGLTLLCEPTCTTDEQCRNLFGDLRRACMLDPKGGGSRICVGCEQSADCGPDAPVCDPTRYQCGGCKVDAHCSRFLGSQYCDDSNGRCVDTLR